MYRRRFFVVGIGLCVALLLLSMQLVLAAGSAQPSELSTPTGLTADPSSNPSAQVSQTDTPPVVQLVSTTGDRIVLKFSAADPTFSNLSTSQGTCQEVTIPGYQSIGEPDHPALPSYVAAVGIPVNANPVVRIVDASYAQLPGSYQLCPEPNPVVELGASEGQPAQITAWERVRDAAMFSTDAFLPQEPVELASTGFLRDQRIAQLSVQPLQYNPVSGELRLATAITVEILLNSPIPAPYAPLAAPIQTTDGPFEDILRTYLLNYGAAQAWRQPRSETSSVGAASATAGAAPFRLQVKEPGLYTITYADLQAADPSLDLATIDPRNFHLSTHDQEVAIEVVGETDGVFNPGDAIFFYAEAINTVYANENVYWLSWDAVPGIRMAMYDGTPSGGYPVPSYFTTTLSLEEDHAYRSLWVTADGDHWYWADLGATGTPVTKAITFAIPGLSTGPITATLTGDLMGYGANPSQAVEIRLNSQLIYTATWPSEAEHTFEINFPYAYLVAGTNSLAVTIGVGNLSDGVLVNRFALIYGGLYTATADRLQFDGDQPGSWQYRPAGFSTSAVRILDITNPKQPVRITPGAAQYNGTSYTLPFEETISGEHHYLATASAQASSPLSIVRDTVVDLRSASNGADYIVITPHDFITAAQSLASNRATQGLRTKVVDIQDIYDAFNSGVPDAEAIHDFLAYVYTSWTAPAPAYVVLLGDGNYDPKDNYGWHEPSPLPPYLAMVDPWIGETAADNRYVCFDGADDQLPDMFIGRLPANSLQEATAMVNKVIAYEQPTTAGTWQGNLLFVADNADTAGDFAADSDSVADQHVPAPYVVDKVYLGITHPVTEPATARAAIIAAINQGRLIVNYAGHGAVQYWAAENLLHIDAASGLTNTNKLPFFVPMTCWEGYFIYPSPPGGNYSGFAETFVRLPTTGAIASWSATGLGLATGHDYLDRGLFDAIFQNSITKLGPATAYAKFFLSASTDYFP